MTTTEKRSVKAPGQPGISRRTPEESEAARESRYVRALCERFGWETWTQLRVWYNLPGPGLTESFDYDAQGPEVRGHVQEMHSDDAERLWAIPGFRDGLHIVTFMPSEAAPEEVAVKVGDGLAGDDLKRALGLTVFVARYGYMTDSALSDEEARAALIAKGFIDESTPR